MTSQEIPLKCSVLGTIFFTYRCLSESAFERMIRPVSTLVVQVTILREEHRLAAEARPHHIIRDTPRILELALAGIRDTHPRAPSVLYKNSIFYSTDVAPAP